MPSEYLFERFWCIFRLEIERKIDNGCIFKFRIDEKEEKISEIKLCNKNKWLVLDETSYEIGIYASMMYVKVRGLKGYENYKLEVTVKAKNDDNATRHIFVDSFEAVGMYLIIIATYKHG